MFVTRKCIANRWIFLLKLWDYVSAAPVRSKYLQCKSGILCSIFIVFNSNEVLLNKGNCLVKQESSPAWIHEDLLCLPISCPISGRHPHPVRGGGYHHPHTVPTGGTPIQPQRGVPPPSPNREVPPSSFNGGGVPVSQMAYALSGRMRVPPPNWEGVPPSWPGEWVPLPWPGKGVPTDLGRETPHPDLGRGYPPQLDLGRGIPLCQLDGGKTPPPLLRGCGRTDACENITFPILRMRAVLMGSINIELLM